MQSLQLQLAGEKAKVVSCNDKLPSRKINGEQAQHDGMEDDLDQPLSPAPEAAKSARVKTDGSLTGYASTLLALFASEGISGLFYVKN